MTPSAALYAIGGAVFVLLGLMHAVYTLADLRRPRRLVPSDPALMAAMQASGVRLARGGTSMWRAWVGFNLSHSLGAVLFGAVAAAWSQWPPTTLPAAGAWLPAAVGAVYLAIGLRWWFKVPNAGIALATVSLMLAALLR